MDEEKLLPCKCGFQWLDALTAEEICHHTAYGRDGGAEYVVLCPRCGESGELKARPEWAVTAWNESHTRPTLVTGQLDLISREEALGVVADYVVLTDAIERLPAHPQPGPSK